jgi:serine/threonine protein kinase/Tfp pilus assembly protein PilF
MIGKTISHYKILEKLGEGGMGVVYKAKDVKLDRFIALKFLPHHLSQSEEEKRRFIQEAKVASALDHPNIGTIYEIDETEDGQMFIAMAYYNGETLKNKIGRGQLPIKEAIDIAIQAAQGLEKAHSEDIVHRDIKPANILLTENGQVKIVDFGLAKLGGQAKLTKTGMTVGTIAYMSPEQTQGTNVDHKTDIWSLGVVLYEMLTGRLPSEGEYEQAVIYSILNEDPQPIRELRDDVSAEFAQVIEKTLQKDPANRYQNCRELFLDLKQVHSLPKSKMTGIEESVPSIAILPFLNMSTDPENEYFSDGLSEDIINSLTKIKDLRVVARTSAFSFKGKDIDIREIGKKLNVDAVLEGSVRKAESRLRITAQLINTANGFHLWSEQYDRVMEDVFAIQDEITLSIVEKLKVELLKEERIGVVKHFTQNQEAYNLYLKGRFCLNKRTEETIKQSIAYFQQALNEDPNYAPAYAGLADSYNLLGAGDYGVMPPNEAFPEAKKAAEMALSLDNTLAEAYTALGWARTVYDWAWRGGEDAYQRAIDLNPGYAPAHHWYGMYLTIIRKHDEAIAEAKKAMEFDPLSLIINSDMAWILHRARQYDHAIIQCHKTLNIDPNFSVARWNLGQAYQQKGMYEEAITEFQKAIDFSGGNPVFWTALGHTYAVSGNRKKAFEILNLLNQLSKTRYILPHLQALIYTGLGDKDQALEWLEKAYKDRTDFIIEANVDPRLDSLRTDSRFKALLKRVGF